MCIIYMCVIVIIAVSMLYSISSNVLYLHAYTFRKYWGNGRKLALLAQKEQSVNCLVRAFELYCTLAPKMSGYCDSFVILTTPTSLEYTCSCEDFTWVITTAREVFFYYTIGLTHMTVSTNSMREKAHSFQVKSNLQNKCTLEYLQFGN